MRILTVHQGTLLDDPVHICDPALLVCIVSGRFSGLPSHHDNFYDTDEHLQFLYIDLFIIIPVAVASKCSCCNSGGMLKDRSGADAAVFTNPPETPDRQPCFKKSFG